MRPCAANTPCSDCENTYDIYPFSSSHTITNLVLPASLHYVIIVHRDTALCDAEDVCGSVTDVWLLCLAALPEAGQPPFPQAAARLGRGMRLVTLLLFN